MTPQQFFDKNLKWFTLVLFILLLFKSVQSCNRNTIKSMSEKQYVHQIDSLKKLHIDYREDAQDSIKRLNFELRLATEKTKSANEKATAVQNAVEKLKSNTTITVKGVEVVKDTIKRK